MVRRGESPWGLERGKRFPFGVCVATFRPCDACIDFCSLLVCWHRAWGLWRAECPQAAAPPAVTIKVRLRTAPPKRGRTLAVLAGTRAWEAVAVQQALRARAVPSRSTSRGI